MAFSLNRAQIIGNLTRDPEIRQTPGGQSVANFGIATNFAWTDQTGMRQEKAEFHNVVAWRKLAEICGQYLKKGMKVYVEGRLQTREWEGQDGVKRFRTEIVADNLIMLTKAGERTAGPFGAEENFDRTPRAIEESVQPVPDESVTSAPARGKKKAAASAPATTEIADSADTPFDDLPF